MISPAADCTGEKVVAVVSPLRALGRPLSGVHRNSSRDSTTRSSFAGRLSWVGAGRPASVSVSGRPTSLSTAQPTAAAGSSRSRFGSNRSLLSAHGGAAAGGAGASSRSLASARSSLISSSRSLLSAAAGASSRTLIAIAEATAAPARHLDGVDVSEDRDGDAHATAHADPNSARGRDGDDAATGIADRTDHHDDDENGPGGSACAAVKFSAGADAAAPSAVSATAATADATASGAAGPEQAASESLAAAATGGQTPKTASAGSCGASCFGCCSACATTTARSACLKRWFPVASDKCSARATAITMFITGFASGLLSGLVGSGGPPQLVAFTQLRLRKDFIRGIKVLATTVSNLIRLGLFIAWKRSLLREPWWVYVSICVASILGAMVGGKLRDYLPGEAVLYVLLFASCGELFGVLDKPTSIVGFSVGMLGWLVTVWVLYRWPGIMRPVASAIACCGGACKRAACSLAARLQCKCGSCGHREHEPMGAFKLQQGSPLDGATSTLAAHCPTPLR